MEVDNQQIICMNFREDTPHTVQKEGISAKTHTQKGMCTAEMFVNLRYEIFS